MERIEEEGAGAGGDGPSVPAAPPRRRLGGNALVALACLFVFGLAALLRGWSLGHMPGQAEARLVTEALLMDRDGSLVPPLAEEGPLAHYSLLGVCALARGLRAAPPATELLEAWRGSPSGAGTQALRLARITALLLGLLAVGGAFLAGYHCGGITGALTAGTALAVAPLVVQHGRLLSPELASTGFVGLGIGLATWAVRSRRSAGAAAAAFLFGLSFGGKIYGALLFIPLFALSLELASGRRRRAGHGLALGTALLLGIALSCLGRLGDPAWWPRYLEQHLAGTSGSLLGLDGHPSGWVHHLTKTLPSALGFPLLTLTGMVGLFFGARSGRYEWRFLFWSFWLFFVVVGGLQDRSARAVLPLAVLLAAGAGLFVASGWKKLRGHPGAAVVTLLVVLMLVYPLEGLASEARILTRPDSRQEVLAFLEEEARKAGRPLEIVTLLPVAAAAEQLPENPHRSRDEYPDLAGGPFRLESLCLPQRQPVMDHRLWPVLDAIRREESVRWDYYIWTGWAEGLLREDLHGGILAASRILLDHAEKSWEFGGPTAAAGALPAGAADRIVDGRGARSPGPSIRVYRLRTIRLPPR